MLNFQSLKTHHGLTYLDGRAVASGPFNRTSLRCCRGLLGWRHYFSLPARGFDLAFILVCVSAVIVASSVAKVIEHCSTFGFKLNFS